jgi:hypothetical protein
MEHDLGRWIGLLVLLLWVVGAFRGLGRRMRSAVEERSYEPPPAPAPSPVAAQLVRKLQPAELPAPVAAKLVAQGPVEPPPVPPAPDLPAPSRRRRRRLPLAQAVVWAEILSPPLAARGPGTLGRPPAL